MRAIFRASIALLVILMMAMMSALPVFANDWLEVRAETPFGQPGEIFDWTVTITNPTDEAIRDVSLDVRYPEGLLLLSARPTQGKVTIERWHGGVNVLVDALAPGATLTLPIQARVTPQYAGNTITASVALNANSGAISVMQEAYVIIVDALPTTGEIPAWRTPLMILLAFGGILILLTSLNGQVRR